MDKPNPSTIGTSESQIPQVPPPPYSASVASQPGQPVPVPVPMPMPNTVIHYSNPAPPYSQHHQTFVPATYNHPVYSVPVYNATPIVEIHSAVMNKQHSTVVGSQAGQCSIPAPMTLSTSTETGDKNPAALEQTKPKWLSDTHSVFLCEQNSTSVRLQHTQSVPSSTSIGDGNSAAPPPPKSKWQRGWRGWLCAFLIVLGIWLVFWSGIDLLYALSKR